MSASSKSKANRGGFAFPPPPPPPPKPRDDDLRTQNATGKGTGRRGGRGASNGDANWSRHANYDGNLPRSRGRGNSGRGGPHSGRGEWFGSPGQQNYSHRSASHGSLPRGGYFPGSARGGSNGSPDFQRKRFRDWDNPNAGSSNGSSYDVYIPAHRGGRATYSRASSHSRGTFDRSSSSLAGARGGVQSATPPAPAVPQFGSDLSFPGLDAPTPQDSLSKKSGGLLDIKKHRSPKRSRHQASRAFQPRFGSNFRADGDSRVFDPYGLNYSSSEDESDEDEESAAQKRFGGAKIIQHNDKTYTLDTPAALEKYLEARRSHYPTAKRIKAKMRETAFLETRVAAMRYAVDRRDAAMNGIFPPENGYRAKRRRTSITDLRRSAPTVSEFEKRSEIVLSTNGIDTGDGASDSSSEDSSLSSVLSDYTSDDPSDSDSDAAPTEKAIHKNASAAIPAVEEYVPIITSDSKRPRAAPQNVSRRLLKMTDAELKNAGYCVKHIRRGACRRHDGCPYLHKEPDVVAEPTGIGRYGTRALADRLCTTAQEEEYHVTASTIQAFCAAKADLRSKAVTPGEIKRKQQAPDGILKHSGGGGNIGDQGSDDGSADMDLSDGEDELVDDGARPISRATRMALLELRRTRLAHYNFPMYLKRP